MTTDNLESRVAAIEEVLRSLGHGRAIDRAVEHANKEAESKKAADPQAALPSKVPVKPKHL